MITNSITGDVIYMVGSMFVDDTDLYCMKESLKTGEKVFEKIQEERNACFFLVTTGGCLMPERSVWYLNNYTCVEGVRGQAKN